MDSIYLWLKFVHVAAITVWVGGTFALVVLNARIGRSGDPAAQAAMGRQSEAFGRTVIGPAMVIALLAGLWMAGQFGIPFDSLWIVWGLVGFVAFIIIVAGLLEELRLTNIALRNARPGEREQAQPAAARCDLLARVREASAPGALGRARR